MKLKDIPSETLMPEASEESEKGITTHPPMEMTDILLPLVQGTPDRLAYKPYNMQVSLANAVLRVSVPADSVSENAMTEYQMSNTSIPMSIPIYTLTPKALAWIGHQLSSAYEEVYNMWQKE